MAEFRDRMPAGSYLIVSIGVNDQAPDVAQDWIAAHRAASQVHEHSRKQIEGYFAGLEIVAPGLVEARSWRTAQLPADTGTRPADALACLGRKGGVLSVASVPAC